METPSAVLYGDLRTYANITNREAAQVLLSDTAVLGSMAPRFRVDDKTWLSRNVVHATPERTPPLADSTEAALNLTARIIRSADDPGRIEELTSHYSGKVCENLAAALDAHVSPDAGSYYLNTVLRIKALPLRRESNRLVLLLMLFIIAGSTGDPFLATRLTETYAVRKLNVDFGTMTTTTAQRRVEPEKLTPALALLRLVGNSVRETLYTLSTDPEGTVIGSLPLGSSTIADVDADVSRNHLRLWTENGTWYAQDLGSTNGSCLISGADRSETVIAPPRKERDPRTALQPSSPVSIANSDTLRLGATTCFLVVSTARRD